MALRSSSSKNIQNIFFLIRQMGNDMTLTQEHYLCTTSIQESKGERFSIGQSEKCVSCTEGKNAFEGNSVLLM